MILDSTGFLEQTLLEEGLLTAEQVEEARHLALETESSPCEAMISLGYIDGKTIALTKAHICETPFIDVEHYEINYENARLLPKAFAEKHLVFPLFMLRGVVTLGTDDPLDLAVMDDVRQILKCEIEPVQCESILLSELITKSYGMGLGTSVYEYEAGSSERGEAARKDDESGPIINAVNLILKDAMRCGASDVHLNPDQAVLHIRFRIDGQLQTRQGPSLAMYQKIVQRLKVMAHLDLTQTRRPQDGKFRFSSDHETVDIRLSIIPTVNGENVVLRLLCGQGRLAELNELGMDEGTANSLRMMLTQPYGMLLVTGPTGSGKTTTLYSILNRMNTPERNILTVEDPVEIRLPLVRQVQVNHEIGLNFASALRSILRQDPDVILVGEIRDEETAEIALQSSLTGHFVMSTLHTNDSAGAIARLLDLNQPAFVINSALLGVVAQRLVRRVCEHCKEADHPETELLEMVGLHDTTGLKHGKGCPHCLQTGFTGRMGIYELLRMTTNMKHLVGGGATTEEIRRLSVQEGTTLMWQDGLCKVRSGQTTLNEILRTVQSADFVSEITDQNKDNNDNLKVSGSCAHESGAEAA